MFKKKQVETWMNCPECNIRLKEHHLSTHMKRVHNKNIEDKKTESLESSNKKTEPLESSNKKTEPSESSNKKIHKDKNIRFGSKAIIGLIIIIVVILAFSISLYFTNENSNSNGQNNHTTNYYVSIDGKGNYSSIQKAVDSASDNDIIYVNSGVYDENIEINKSIALIGEDKNTTIINGNGSGIVINILADNVKISGFTIRNGGPTSSDLSNAGIVIRSIYNTISDCNISSNKNYGLYLFANTQTPNNNNIIKNNIFSNNKYGINSYYAKSNNISSNTFTYNTEYGIYLGSHSDDNLILDNIFTENDYAIRIKTSEENTVIKNLIINNTNGLLFCCGSNNNIVYHNVFINNTNYNADDPLENTWDNGYPSGGNYWSDYTGLDNYNGPNQDIPGADGIGDTPYIENLKIGDNFPLMEPI